MNKVNPKLKQWCFEQLGHYGEHEGQFWLCAFVKLVREKEAQWAPRLTESVALYYAFNEAVRELGLEK